MNKDGVVDVAQSLKPHKRAREDKDAPQSPEPHKDLWFDDGNIILVAEDTSFRVHKSVLASKSVVFNDLFTVPQPATTGEKNIEGCPVIPLSDTAFDLATVLKSMYHGLKCSSAPYDWIPVRAFLRLGEKYDIDEVRNEAWRQLRFRIPEDLKKPRIIPEAEAIDMANHTASLTPTWAHDAALLSCCYATPQALVYGCALPDGTHVQLSKENLRSCIAGQRRLSISLRKIFSSIQDCPTSCEDDIDCRWFRSYVLEAWWDREEFCNALNFEETGMFKDLLVEGMCDLCMEDTRTWLLKERQKLLDTLHEMFC